MNLVTRLETVDAVCALCNKDLSGRHMVHLLESSEHPFHESCVVNHIVQSILSGYSPACPVCKERVEYLDALKLPPPLPREGTMPESERIGCLPRAVACAASVGNYLIVRKLLETHHEMIKPNLRAAILAAASVDNRKMTEELLHQAGEQFCEIVRAPRPFRDRDLPTPYLGLSEVPKGPELINLLFMRRMLTEEGVARSIVEGVKRGAPDTAMSLIPSDTQRAIRIFSAAVCLAAEENDPLTRFDGSQNLIQQLLGLGPIFDLSCGDAVLSCVKNNNLIGIKILLNSRTISSSYRTKAINLASEMGAVDMVHLLLPITDEQRIEAIEIAVQSGKPRVLHELLNGWDLTPASRAHFLAEWVPMAISHGINEEIAQTLTHELELWSPITDEIRGKIFIPVIEKGWIRMMNRLLKEGTPNDVLIAAWPVALKQENVQLASDLNQFRLRQT